jgi:GT2 family glycosyltransferase
MAAGHRVSFVIPARNEDPAVLRATVAGVLASAPGRWREVIVIDDASATRVDVAGPEVTVIRRGRASGVSGARRLGAAAATGDVLVWLDAHLSFGPGWIEAILAEVDSGALLCTPWRDYTRTRVHGWGSDFGWSGAWDTPQSPRPGFDYAARTRRPRARVVPVPMVIGGCYAMARAAYERLGGFSPLFRVYWGDEFDLSARVWLSGGRVHCVTRAEVGHLDRPRHPYPVSWSHVEHNQLMLVRTVFEADTAALLEEFLRPLPEEVERWTLETDAAGWRGEVQGRRRMSDAEFFQRLAPRVPVTFVDGKVRARRGHVPRGRQWAAVVAEERMLGRALSAAATLAPPASGSGGAMVTGSSYGVRFSVRVPDASWLAHVVPRLPPGLVADGPGAAAIDVCCAIVDDSDPDDAGVCLPGRYGVDVGSHRILSCAPVPAALDALERSLDHAIAARTDNHLFVRAGVVGWKGRALVLPGGHLTGRRALTVALTRAGATYYSDTFAVLDGEGRVSPYARPLRLDGGASQVDPSMATQARDPLPIGVIAVISLGNGRAWSLRPVSSALAFRALYERSLVRDDAVAAVRIVTRAVRGAVALAGRRGPVGPVASRLLWNLDTAAAAR